MRNRISKTKKIVLCAALSLFAAGAGVYAANTTYGAAYAASNSVQNNAFTFTNGASVRVDEHKDDSGAQVTGIRFEASIAKDKYEALLDEEKNGFKTGCEAGMIIVPEQVLAKWEEQKDTETGETDIFKYIQSLQGVDGEISVSFAPNKAKEQENGYLVRGVVDIKECNYLFGYQAAAYIKTDGAIEYDVFSDVRSLAYVANEAMLDTEEETQPSDAQKQLLADKLEKIVGMKLEKAGYQIAESGNAATLTVTDLSKEIDLASFFEDITDENLAFSFTGDAKIASLTNKKLLFNKNGEATVKVTAYSGKFEYTLKITANNAQIADLYTKISAGNSVTEKAYIDESGDAVLKFSHNQARNLGSFNRLGINFNVDKIKENMSDGNFVKFQLKYDEPEATEGADKYLWMSYNYYNSDASTSNVGVGDYHWAPVYYYDANGVAGKRGDGTKFTDDGAMRAGEWYTYYVKLSHISTGTFFYLCFYQYKDKPAIEIPEFTGYIKNIEYVEKDTIGEAQAALKSQTGVGNKVTSVYGMDGNAATVTLSTTAHFQQTNAWQQAGLQFKVKDNIGENDWIKMSFKIDGSTNVSTGVFFNAGGTLVWFYDSYWYDQDKAYCVNADGNKVLTGEIVADQWYTIYYKITNKTKEQNEYYISFYDKNYDSTAETHKTVNATVKNIEYVANKPTV